jgi:hypothetical protein
MAHFALLNASNEVLNVIVVANADTANSDGVEQESIGVAFLHGLFGDDTIWKQTSYNARIRGEYAGIGFTYDAGRDVFVSPSPYSSWTYDYTNKKWEPPVAYPRIDGSGNWELDAPFYEWDEDNRRWNEITE